MAHNSILFDLGIVLFLGFFAALIMKKLGQSVIIGYMLAGILIGPNVLRLVSDLESINSLSELGIVLLMFFLGLEFSINKFRKIKNSVFFIGTYEVILNLALGYITGMLLGLFVKERLFLAGIIALSSSGVVAKLLFDMKRTASKESEILMGVMVFEDFFAIVLLGILSSFATEIINIKNIALSVSKALLFYAVFILIGIVIINKLTDTLMQVDSQELFTALMLGIILLIGSLAVKIGLASAAGAFLIGMIINSYDIEERMHRTISAFKDIFLIVFFISFGMLLNPAQIPGILWIVAIVVPITVFGELVITSSSAFFSGFSSRSAIAIGASMIARGEYSLIYAKLGYSMGAISESLYQFTGVYVFVMTLLAPIAMKHSKKIRDTLSFITPGFIKYSSKLISVTMKPLLLPEEFGVKIQPSYKFIFSFVIYLSIVIIAFITINVYVLIPITLVGLFLIYELRKLFAVKIKDLEEQIDYHSIHEGPFILDTVVKFILNLFTSLLIIILLGASFWNYGHIILVGLLLIFSLYILGVSIYTYMLSKKHSHSS